MLSTLKDIGLLLSLGLNVVFVWFLARRDGGGGGSSPPADPAHPPAPARPPSPEDLQRVRDQLAAGNKIQAIKLYRDITGCGLKEAKDAVEAM